MKNREILEKLADRLPEVHKDNFSLIVWGKGDTVAAKKTKGKEANCGYVGCAIGWLPHLCPEVENLGFKVGISDKGGPNIAPAYDGKLGLSAIGKFFDLDIHVVTWLFFSEAYSFRDVIGDDDASLYIDTTDYDTDVYILDESYSVPTSMVVKRIRLVLDEESNSIPKEYRDYGKANYDKIFARELSQNDKIDSYHGYNDDEYTLD